jgi:type IV pilus assembly protein PilW
MAREIRESAGNPCEAGLPTVNVLNIRRPTGGVRWTAACAVTPARPPSGDEAFGTAAGVRLTGTDAIELKSAVSDGVSVVSHNAAAASFKVSTINHGLSNGDVAIVCDFDHAAIFQITNASPGLNDTIVHNTGIGTPGNCTKGLGFSAPTLCTALGTPYTYGANSIIARLRMERWYIANNNRGGRSLFQSLLVNNAARCPSQAGNRRQRDQHAGAVPAAGRNQLRQRGVGDHRAVEQRTPSSPCASC